MDTDVQLISCWEECFFRRKGEIGFFLPFPFFFFPRHIFYLYVCIKDCQEMHLVPKSRISHSSFQLTAFQAPFFVISAQISCRQSSLDRWPTPHGKKKNRFLINARKNGTYGIFRVALHPRLLLYFAKLIFWLIFSAARANASLIKFPHHPPLYPISGFTGSSTTFSVCVFSECSVASGLAKKICYILSYNKI